MANFPMFLAYLGPETMLPMTSVLAAVAGVLMMLGRNSWLWLAGVARRLAPWPVARPKPVVRIRRIGTGPMIRTAAETMTGQRVED